PILAETLITKGASMAVEGRVWEGVGLARAGLLLADQHGLTLTSQRAKISLTGTLTVYDPREAYRLGVEAYTLARRLGQRHSATIAAANAGEAGLELGAIDEAIAMMRDVASFDLEDGDAATVEGVTIELIAVKGEPTAERLASLATMGDESDPVFGAMVGLARVWAGLAEGRFADAHAAGRRVAELSGLNRPYGLLYAARAAIRDGDGERARAAFDALVALSVRGPALDLWRLGIEAGVDALEGRWAEAALKFAHAFRELREMGTDFHLALVELDAVAVGPAGDRVVAAAAEDARAILTRIGAAPFLAQLDGLLAGGAPSAGPVGEHEARRSATASA